MTSVELPHTQSSAAGSLDPTSHRDRVLDNVDHSSYDGVQFSQIHRTPLFPLIKVSAHTKIFHIIESATFVVSCDQV